MTKNDTVIAPLRPIHISAKGQYQFSPPDLQKMEPMPVFHLWVPTFAQRDSISQLVFQHGVMPVTPEQGRSVLISELYAVYDTDPDAEGAGKRWVEQPDPANPDETIQVQVPKKRGDPDEMAGFLEGFWQRADIYEQIIQDWALQEKERILDEFHGADRKDGTPMPGAPYTPRESARAKMIATGMLDDSSNYRDLQSKYADYASREDLVLFRLFCAGWDGLKTVPVSTKVGPLSAACVEALRAELAPLDPADPNHFYREVVQEIRQLMVVDRETEKNFASPLGIDSSPSGSEARSGGSDDGNGGWTESIIEPAPASASQPTSDTSSSSRSEVEGPKPKPGRTEAP